VRSNELGVGEVEIVGMSGPKEEAPSLLAVRREIERIDRALVLLVAARVEAACSAIRIRSETDGQISDSVQEELVIARAQAWAEQVGISPTFVETMFRAVLAAGKERFRASPSVPWPHGEGPRERANAHPRGGAPRRSLAQESA
jgi:chorismate mutase